MILPAWVPPVLIGIDVLVVIYGLRVVVTEKKWWGGLLALAFFLFGTKELLTYNGLIVSSAVSLGISVAGLACALCAFYLLAKALPS